MSAQGRREINESRQWHDQKQLAREMPSMAWTEADVHAPELEGKAVAIDELTYIQKLAPLAASTCHSIIRREAKLFMNACPCL